MAKIIKLTKGYEAIVDDEDYERISKYSWHASGREPKVYAASRINYKIIYLHRFIMGVSDRDFIIDHKDRNSLNNQKQNLRNATQSLNAANCTRTHPNKYIGAYLMYGRLKKDGTKTTFWYAKCGGGGKSIRCNSEIEAAIKYNQLAKELYGEFADLNIIPDGKEKVTAFDFSKKVHKIIDNSDGKIYHSLFSLCKEKNIAYSFLHHRLIGKTKNDTQYSVYA